MSYLMSLSHHVHREQVAAVLKHIIIPSMASWTTPLPLRALPLI